MTALADFFSRIGYYTWHLLSESPPDRDFSRPANGGRTGLAALLMKGLSGFFKTEQAYTGHDLEKARHGAGFAGAIEHLAGDTDTD